MEKSHASFDFERLSFEFLPLAYLRCNWEFMYSRESSQGFLQLQRIYLKKI